MLLLVLHFLDVNFLELNSVLQGRHFKLHCVNRLYDDKNATVWLEQLYGAQVLCESLPSQPHHSKDAI